MDSDGDSELDGTPAPAVSVASCATIPRKKRPIQEVTDAEENIPQIESGKKSKQSSKISIEQEQEAIEWLRDHPELYAKKSAKNMDTEYKTRLIRDKAEEMGLPGRYLRI